MDALLTLRIMYDLNVCFTLQICSIAPLQNKNGLLYLTVLMATFPTSSKHLLFWDQEFQVLFTSFFLGSAAGFTNNNNRWKRYGELHILRKTKDLFVSCYFAKGS